jgi:hypothetical protein
VGKVVGPNKGGVEEEAGGWGRTRVGDGGGFFGEGSPKRNNSKWGKGKTIGSLDQCACCGGGKKQAKDLITAPASVPATHFQPEEG